MSRLVELLDELKQDLSLEAGECKDWGMREVLTTTIQRVEEIRSQAVKSGGEGHCRPSGRKLCGVAEGGEK